MLGGHRALSRERKKETLHMDQHRLALTATLLLSLALIASEVTADHTHGHEHDDQTRRHDAHVHGIAVLNLALEGREVHIELDSPAANIAGFEHAPASDADHAALDRAAAALKDGDRLFRFNAEAGCRMENAAFASALLDEGQGRQADAHTGDHARGALPGHRRDDHAREGGTHADIQAAYRFACDQPGRLAQLAVELFDAFPQLEKLKMHYVIERSQGAAELTRGRRVVEF